MNKAFFKSRANLIKIIGKELISSEIIAIIEVIKNSYDADATEVNINLTDIFSEKGIIEIIDNGLGMDYNTITTVWMEPATPNKFKKENKFSRCFQRRILGEKGIGRFAVHRLGNQIDLISRASIDCFSKFDHNETKVVINWNDFTEDKYFEKVPVTISEDKPEVFKESSGTYLKISNITPWNEKMLKLVIQKIKSLESPAVLTKEIRQKIRNLNNKQDPGFVINFRSNNKEILKIIEEVENVNSVLNKSFYKFSALIDENGLAEYSYSFNRPDYQYIKRNLSDKCDITENNIEYFNKLKIELKNNNIELKDTMPGPFIVEFYAWDLEPSALKIAGLSTIYRSLIRPNSGIRIYRDGFRVWPYGEEDDDWLGLDLKRLNFPKERTVSRNQIIGFVFISADDNPELRDQSNREGLQKNLQYNIFYELLLGTLNEFALLRKQDKIKLEKLIENDKIEDSVFTSIDRLKIKISDNKHNELYHDDVISIENNYKERINDVLERYMLAAAIGISYSLPVHEMKLRLKTINDIAKELQNNPTLQDKYLRELFIVIKDTQDTVKAISSIMSRQKKRDMDLSEIVNNCFILKEKELNNNGIDFYCKKIKSIYINAVPSLISSALLNLIDNSIYWIKVKRKKVNNVKFKGLIQIENGIEKERPYIRVIDNGTGIKDSLELIIEPYYSRKSDGLGLGLYLTNEIILRNNGYLKAYNNDQGATFELHFEKEKINE